MHMRKALLVEDSSGQREILSRILMEQGWWIVEAEDGRQGMKQMSEHDDIELIMLDLYMPVMDGMEFLSVLRTTPEYSEAPKVLMMSVERAMPTVQQALAAGADEYIMKPFSIELLNQKLSSMGFGEMA
jgi:two-component system chemotaxis response regulator CheY